MKQGSFFSDDEIRNKRNDTDWSAEEDDQLFDLYFGGTAPDRIAVKMRRNPKSIARRLEQFTYNERSMADLYRPRRRINRRGMRLTENERVMVKAHTERGVASETTARLFQRAPNEFSTDFEGVKKNNRLREVASSVDIIIAHRYLAYCAKCPIISKQAYDAMVEEEIEFGGGADILARYPKSANVTDYPPHIRSLAYYMQFKYWQSKGESSDMVDKMPHGMVTEYKEKHKPKERSFSGNPKRLCVQCKEWPVNENEELCDKCIGIE